MTIERALGNVGRCATCSRKLYDDKTPAPFSDYASGPFNSLLSDDWSRMHEEWGWRSKWTPELCRFCDKDHDHRESPGLRYRLQRWWKERFL